VNFLTRCSILHGCLAADGTLYLTIMNDALAEQREQHAIPLMWRGGTWSCIDEEPFLPWLAAGVGTIGSAGPLAAIVGWGGQVLTVGPDGCGREGLQRPDGSSVAVVRAVATVGDTVYAVCMRRQVYRRIGTGQWEAIDRGVADEGDEGADVGFEAIDGFDDTELYAAGLNGEVWQRRDARWHAIAAPTNVHLSALTCGADGFVMVGGRTGTLLRGRDDAWEIRALPTQDTIWDICRFGPTLYLRLGSDVVTYAWDTDEMVPLEGLHDAARLVCRGERLLVLGRKRIVSVEGAAWREIDTELDADAIAPSLRDLLGGDDPDA